jgi:hypothetical protein
VCKRRERFLAGGLDGLSDEPRPGTPGKSQVEALITRGTFGSVRELEFTGRDYLVQYN